MGTDLMLVVASSKEHPIWKLETAYNVNRDYYEFDKIRFHVNEIPKDVQFTPEWNQNKIEDEYGKRLTYLNLEDLENSNLSAVDMYGFAMFEIKDRFREYENDTKIILYWK